MPAAPRGLAGGAAGVPRTVRFLINLIDCSELHIMQLHCKSRCRSGFSHFVHVFCLYRATRTTVDPINFKLDCCLSFRRFSLFFVVHVQLFSGKEVVVYQLSGLAEVTYLIMAKYGSSIMEHGHET